MQTNNLGYPRIGSNRELKKSSEKYWAGKTSLEELVRTGAEVRRSNWELQKKEGIDLIPSNDFSFYDQVLDMALMTGAIPERYHKIMLDTSNAKLDLYFAMARGYQKNDLDLKAMEMTKWFDTNYHYMVPEFIKDQKFELFSTKVIDEFIEAKNIGIKTKPVLIGPVSFILLGKEKESGFHRLELLKNIVPVYIEIISRLKEEDVEWIQFDEPFLNLDLDEKTKEAFIYAYGEINKQFPLVKKMIATYFEGLKDNTALALSLPVQALHLDLVRCPDQLDEVLNTISQDMKISLGVVDGRNIWKNNFQNSLKIIYKAINKIGKENIFISPSCSLIHSPCDLDLETNEKTLTPEIKQWLAFSKQKIQELVTLKHLADHKISGEYSNKLNQNKEAHKNREVSDLIHDKEIKNKMSGTDIKTRRDNSFPIRKNKQNKTLKLPLLPTTTIGSFPQTKEVRSWRSQYKKNEISIEQYEQLLKSETEKAIRFQEKIGLDVLVHGEFERNDMVEYFGEQLKGFVFSKNGWVQSYGSRCVKPPIIYGDVSRANPMTVKWSAYAQSLTEKKVKGMLTGPVTILQWSFVRNDQPRSETCKQIALAIKEEVEDLEKAGIQIIQIDEPAIREGLPLRKSDWDNYLQWAVGAFKISSSSVKDETQIHTHMCYSEFNDIIHNIAEMDADVITIECSRSNMELLDIFSKFKYPNDIGPGVYDIHSPRIPSKEEMVRLLEKASEVIPVKRLWVNPDCGLKTRNWEETGKALEEMVKAALVLRKHSTFTK